MATDVCILVRSAPYGTVMPAEALRSAIGLNVFDHDITLLLMDDGVLSLARASEPGGLGMKPLQHAVADLAGLPGITVAVHLPSLEERGLDLDDLVPPPEGAKPYRLLGSDELEGALTEHKAVIRF